ncbi:FG-GAP-like repeat-containing protein [Dehalococcoidia bacterium]|nr:FG-GAP-like repeat-containing protein [Dehalococcoidia bacterium]
MTINVRMRINGIPNSFYDTGFKKRRIVGLVLLAVLLTLFLVFNRLPKLDTVQADLAVATSPVAQCFQGFCIESAPESSLLSRWWDFSLTYLQLVSLGMGFAFLVAGLTEAFLFPKSSGWGLSATGIKGSLKGLLVGPAMNLCSACIVPVASAFRRRGSGVETTLSITQGSSTLNLPALIMAVMVFAPMIGGSRIGLSLVGALLIGPLVAKVVRGDDESINDSPPSLPEEPDQVSWREAIGEGSREWVRITASHVIRLAPVMILAGFASGLAMQWISPQTVTTWMGDDVLGILIAATLGIAINVPLLFEIPLVAVLLLAGMGTAPASVLLFTAAAGGPITFWGLAKVMPRKAIVTFGSSTWGLGVAGGVVVLFFVSLGSGPDFELRADYSTATHPATDFSGRVSGMRFTDVTQQAGLTYWHHVPEPLFGQIEPPETIGGAVAEDFDGDGWVDLFVLRGGEAPSLLYMNQGDGTFTEEGNARGADLPTKLGAAAAAADYDNDGDIDIVVSKQRAPHYLLINDGSGQFTVDATMLTAPETFATSPSWGDVDNDGMLELVLGDWIPKTAQDYDTSSKASNEQPSQVGLNPTMGVNGLTPLFMYRNTGQGRLEPYEFRIVPAVDLWVFSPRFADLNGDGLTDLAVVADFMMSRLYLNVGDGMFEFDADTTDILTEDNGMGAAIGDYDNDGDLDWFVTSIYGHPSPPAPTGNRLYRNDAGMVFADVTGDAGVRDGSWGWAASFGDLDNDGDLDLYHVNGWIKKDGLGSPEEFNNQPARLFENMGDRGFHEVAGQVGAGDRGQGRGVILFDYDNDGDLDIFITNNHEYLVDEHMPWSGRSPAAPVLLRNDTINGNHWLKVTLEGSPPLHRDGIGSRVYVTTGDVTQMRELHASTNYLTQEPGRIAHFGVGAVTIIDEVRTEWVDGEINILTNVQADQHISISSR